MDLNFVKMLTFSSLQCEESFWTHFLIIRILYFRLYNAISCLQQDAQSKQEESLKDILQGKGTGCDH